MRLVFLLFIFLFWAVTDIGSAHAETIRSLQQQGVNAFEANRFDEAVSFWQRALSRAEDQDNDQASAMLFRLLSRGLQAINRTDDALRQLEEALEIYQDLEEPDEVGIVLKEMGELDLATGRYDRALTRLLRALNKNPDDVELLRAVGLAHYKLNNNNQALQSYQKALDSGDDSSELHSGLANVYNVLGQYDQAQIHYRKLLSSIPISDESARATILSNIGVLHEKKKAWDEAMALHQEVNAIFTRLDQKQNMANNLNNIGNVLSGQHDYYQALKYYQQAHDIYKGLAPNPLIRSDLFMVSGNIACAFRNIGLYKQALNTLEQVLKHFTAVDDRRNKAGALANLANIHEDLGDYQRALERNKEALKLLDDIRDMEGQAKVLNSIGVVYQKQGNWPEALKQFEHSSEIYQQLGIPAGYVDANIGDLLLAQGELEQARIIFEKLNDQLRKSRYLLLTGAFKQAREGFTQRLKHARKLGLNNHIQACLIGLGLACEQMGNPTQGADSFKQAIMAMERQRSSLPLPARVRFLSGEVVGFKRIEAYEGLIRTRLAQGRPAEALKWSEATKSRTLLEQLTERGKIGHAILPTTLQTEEDQLTRRLSLLFRKREQAFRDGLHDRVKQLDKDIEQVESQLNSFVEQLYRTHPVYAALMYPRSVTLDQLATGEQETLILYEVTDPQTIAFVIKDRKILKVIRIDVSRETLEQEVERFRIPLTSDEIPYPDYDAKTGSRLFKILLSEAVEDIPAGERLTLIPDECLALLPFEALLVKSMGKTVPPKKAIPVQNKRGIVDRATILQALQPPIIRRRLEIAPSTQPSVNIPINFAYDSSTLKPDGILQLQELIAALSDPILKGGRFRIEGHTDSKGPAAYNRGLSKARAKHVLDQLILAGQPGINYSTVGYGESCPIADNSTQEGRRQNRRVQLVRLEVDKAMTSHTFPSDKELAFMLDRNRISYYPSATVMRFQRLLQKHHPYKNRLFALGNPIFSLNDQRVTSSKDGPSQTVTVGDFRLAPLPGTRKEVTSVARLFDNPLLLMDEEARESAVKEAKLDQFDLILFATHGLLGYQIPNIREPSLVMTLVGNQHEDGFLTLSEILTLDIRARTVVLSACQSGMGVRIAGEGMMGLSRAFLSAGSQSVVGTLWSVADKSSANLIISFFTKLCARKDAVDALYEAKKELRKRGFNHPFFWAPYILIGETR